VVTIPYSFSPILLSGFDPNTGKALWSSPKTFVPVSYVVQGSSLYSDSLTGLQKFDIRTKGLVHKWSLPLGKPNSVVIAVDDTASTIVAKVAQFDIHTYKEACSEIYVASTAAGKGVLWNQTLPTGTTSVTCQIVLKCSFLAAAVTSNAAGATVAGTGVSVYDVMTGALHWHAPTGTWNASKLIGVSTDETGGPPTGVLFSSSVDASVVSVSKTGKVDWDITEAQFDTFPTDALVDDEGVLYMAGQHSGHDTLLAFK
jgi:hypothetical protein